MKTAEEWMQLQEPKALQPATLLVVNRQIIREIQLDAMKEGARRAAEECNTEQHPLDCETCRMTVKENILTTAEQWTKKDL